MRAHIVVDKTVVRPVVLDQPTVLRANPQCARSIHEERLDEIVW